MKHYKDDCVKLYDVGDVLYRVGKYGIEQITITKVDTYPHYVYKDDKGRSYFNHSIIKSCFKTQEEAEQEAQRRKKVTEKKQMLKEYEQQLNQKLGLVDHFIIK